MKLIWLKYCQNVFTLCKILNKTNLNMKIGKVLVGVVLWIAVLFLAYKLYDIIQAPVQFEADYNKHFNATTTRMYDIKAAQGYYLKSKKKYAGNFDDLINSIKNDMITEVIINGNPDDTSVVATYDTLKYYIKDELKFEGTNNVDSLRYVPFSGGETFDLESGMLKMQRVDVPVYQIDVPKSKYLKGLNEDYVERKKDLSLGSLTQATEKASWE